MVSHSEVIMLEDLSQEYDQATNLISVLAGIRQARIGDPEPFHRGVSNKGLDHPIKDPGICGHLNSKFSAFTEDPADLHKGSFGIGEMVQKASRNDAIKALVGEGEAVYIASNKLKLRK